MAMAIQAAGRKLHGLSKNERLCNFSYKKILFEQGAMLHVAPFLIYWKIIDTNLESIFFGNSLTTFEGDHSNESEIIQKQNPSWPLKKVSQSALFYFPVKCLFGVSKKNFRKAVDRNHIKRLMKEAYRKNKSDLYTFLEKGNKLCLIGIIYTGKTLLSYDETETKIIVSLQRLIKEFEKK